MIELTHLAIIAAGLTITYICCFSKKFRYQPKIRRHL